MDKMKKVKNSLQCAEQDILWYFVSLTLNMYILALKSRFLKNRELYWSNLPQNSNLGRESFVQNSGVRIPVGEGQIIWVNFQFIITNYLFTLAGNSIIQ